MARLIWTEPALSDLDRIADVIALDKPGAARTFVQRVFRAVERLALFPKSGRVPPEIADLPYREVLVPPCRVIYRVGKGAVLVIHVLRSEQELRPETFESEGE